MNLKWIIQDELENNKIVQEFAEEINVPEIISRTLIKRGIDTFEKAKLFFRGGLSNLYDPFLMSDMQKAVDRIIKALNNKEKILIYGDYDVDGITSVSLLYLLLNELGADVCFYIPHRIKEGYGISITGIDEAVKKDVNLIITVDCGITALSEIKYAHEKNIDVIISDHHEPAMALPDACAILNPKCEESNYPFKELAGVGVAYKLGQALTMALNLDEKVIENYIDLVAVGSAADIVPLVDENRIFVKEGLLKLNQTNNKGIKALLKVTNMDNKQIGTGQIVFVIAPRINAVGRMGNAERAVELLATNSADHASKIANILETENKERKNVDEATFRLAQEIVAEKYDLKKNYGLVLAKEGWHPGVVGIVASRVVEKHYRPTIMISIDNEIGKGSARSIAGFDIYLALKECEDILVAFGGHKYAAGLTIEKDKIPEFRKRFNEIAMAQLDEDLLSPKLRIDGEIRFGDINKRLIHLLKIFAPFGPQNMRPVFLSQKLQVVGTPSIVGNNHLKFKVRQDGVILDAIGFNLGDLIYRIEPGESNLDMVYVIEENTYLGRTNLQLRIKDLR